MRSGVATVMKILILTPVVLCMICVTVELFNANANAGLTRERLDKYAELALEYYQQESYRGGGVSGTFITEPDSILGPGGVGTYISGGFYDFKTDPVRQSNVMYKWNNSQPSGVDMFALGNLTEGQSYSYGGCTYTCEKLPRDWDVVNYDVNGDHTVYSLELDPATYPQRRGMGYYYSDWAAYMYGHEYSIHHVDMTVHNTLSGNYGQAALSDIADSYKDRGLTPANMYAIAPDPATFNRVLRWYLASGMLGGGNGVNVVEGDFGQPCVRYMGFDIYADQARLTGLDYYLYNLRDPVDKLEYEDLTGVDADNLYLKDGIAMAVYIHYTVPIDYHGFTDLKRIINFSQTTNDNAGGYAEFVGTGNAANLNDNVHGAATMGNVGADVSYSGSLRVDILW